LVIESYCHSQKYQEMLKNYLIISFRNLRKHFSYSFVNIFGLSMGLTICLLLITWINHELSYDKFHKMSENIYRPSLEMSFGGQSLKTSVSPTALLPALQQFPEIEAGVRIDNPSGWNAFVVKKDDHVFQEDHFYFADSTFFDVFTFKLLKGNPKNALREPYSVILTSSSAKKYFGDTDAFGKTINVNGTQDYTVTGIMADVPSNSFLQFDFLGSFSSRLQSREQPIWWSANYQTFVIIRDHTNIAALSAKTDQLVRKAIGSELNNPSDVVHYNFMKLTDIHLRSPYESEFEVVGNIQYVYIFSAIALLIVLIACINYVNLSTARAIDRAREVGIRKVVGALRKQLFIQFMGESAMITGISFVLAFFTAQLLLPLFNSISHKNLDADVFYNPAFLSINLLMLVLIALLSGAYPATVITAFKPVTILKGNFKFSGRGVWLRKFLVITQFSISILLIVGTLVILKQLDFIQNKKLGYKKDNVLVLPLDNSMDNAYRQLTTEFLRTGDVSNTGRATESPTMIRGGYGFNLAGRPDNEGLILTAIAADTGFIPTLGIDLIQGRNFTQADFRHAETDTVYAFIINESLLKILHLDEKTAIGTKARVSGRKGEIVGVVSDFHFASLHNSIGPLVIFSEQNFNHMFVKLNTNNVSLVLKKLKAISAKIVPQRPFEYQFLDEQYGALYASEERMGIIFTIFAVLAIVIACLGLLGLVSFSAAQKTKEIGIRKVMGATATSIVVLITKDFTKLVLIAIVLAIPLSFWIMNLWLNDFAYKTTIGIWPVVAASAVCIVIAYCTAGFQAIKAALINPAKTLRNE
jgi:putative ABC transport system permease protein